MQKIKITDLNPLLIEMAKNGDKKDSAIWAYNCASRVLSNFEEKYPKDKRPGKALETLFNWIKTGEFKMDVIRKASLDSHEAAREAIDLPARYAARACGQAVATAHVITHAPGAAIYALKSIQEATDSEEKIKREQNWQLENLKKLKKL